MATAVKEIEQEILALSGEEKIELQRSLIAELDAPAGPRFTKSMEPRISSTRLWSGASGSRRECSFLLLSPMHGRAAHSLLLLAH